MTKTPDVKLSHSIGLLQDQLKELDEERNGIVQAIECLKEKQVTEYLAKDPADRGIDPRGIKGDDNLFDPEVQARMLMNYKP